MALTRALLISSLSAALSLLLCGCGPSPEPAESAIRPGTPQKLRLAVIAPSATDAYWTAAQSGARRAATEFNLDLEWSDSAVPESVEAQITLYNTHAASGRRGILIAASDAQALAPHIRAASALKVATVLLNAPRDTPAGTDYVSVVASDERAAGRTAAHTLEALIGGSPAHGGRVLLLRHPADSAATRQREEGFGTELASFSGLTLVVHTSADPSLAGTQSSPATLLDGYVRDNQLALAGLFASHPAVAEQAAMALQALRERGVEITAKSIGFDESAPLLAALQTGVLDALVVRDPEKLGYLAVKSAVQHLQGTIPPAYLDAGVKVKTRANLSASASTTPSTPPATSRDIPALPTHPVGAPIVLD